MGVQSYRFGKVLFWDKEARKTVDADPSWATAWRSDPKSAASRTTSSAGRAATRAASSSRPNTRSWQGRGWTGRIRRKLKRELSESERRRARYFGLRPAVFAVPLIQSTSRRPPAWRAKAACWRPARPSWRRIAHLLKTLHLLLGEQLFHLGVISFCSSANCLRCSGERPSISCNGPGITSPGLGRFAC